MGNCSGCGAECLVAGDSWTKWACQSYSEFGHMTQSVNCLRRQLAAANERVGELEMALAALEESPWRSMESAPRDGTWIEVGRHIDGQWEYCKSGYFHDAGDVMSGEPPYDFWAADYDMRGVTNDDGMWLTHWRPCDDGPAMPLPAAPEVPK